MRLKAKKAVITGAASGIGRAGVELFTREGATVAALDIDGAGLEQVVADAEPGKVIPIVADLSDRDACRRAIREAIAGIGGIDILWAHAGVPIFGDPEGLDLEQVDMASNLNLIGPMIMIGEMMSHIRTNRAGGSIVLTSSVSGLVGSTQSPTYSMHKFGVIGLAKALCLSLGQDGVRVNAVCPGHIRTPAFDGFMRKAIGKDDIEEAVAERGPIYAPALGRVGQPDEIAHAALWLASDDASYVTGQALAVDGGYTAK